MNKRELRIALERVDPLSHNSFDDLLDELYDELQAAQAPASGEVDEKGSLPWFCRVYNSGYHAGHHDTVEGGYTHIYPQDMDDYHEDVVMEILEDVQQEHATTTPETVGDEHLPDMFWLADNNEEMRGFNEWEFADSVGQDMDEGETKEVRVQLAKSLPDRWMRISVDDDGEARWAWIKRPQQPKPEEN